MPTCNHILKPRHLHFGTMVETREQLTWLMENTDPDYNDWIMVELDSTTRTQIESARISKKYFEDKLKIKV